MADLPTIAQRLNDTEIAASAPLTETLMRRIGSNINLLLDAFGFTNGDTSASGILNDLTVAIDTINSHTLALQASIPPTNGLTTVIGTYPQIKFVNRVFLVRATADFGAFRAVPLKNVDGNGNVLINASAVTPPSTQIGANTPAQTNTVWGTNSQFMGNMNFDGVNSFGSPNTPNARFFDAALGVVGYESRMRNNEWFEMCELDWREGASTVISVYKEGGNAVSTGDVYMGYRFNVESAPLSY